MLTASEIRGEFGKRLRKAREERGLDQSQLARHVGLKPSAISHFECARRMPTIETMMCIAEALKVSPARLLGLDSVPELGEVTSARLAKACGKLGARDLETVIALAEHLVKN